MGPRVYCVPFLYAFSVLLGVLCYFLVNILFFTDKK